MNKEEFISLMEVNNEKLVNIMDKRIEAKIEANNEKLANIMDEKIEANNEKLAKIIDEKIEANNVKIADIIDEKVDNSTKEIASEIQLILRQINRKFLEIDGKFSKFDEKFSKIDKRFDELEEKIDFNKSYFEKNYGQKIEFLIDKIKLNDQIRIMDNKELEIYLKHNQELLNSHDIRITNLENVANSN